jgi:hypothetical protein
MCFQGNMKCPAFTEGIPPCKTYRRAHKKFSTIGDSGSFTYALVARNRMPLAEFPPAPSSNSQIVTSILSQLSARAGTLSAERGASVYCTLTDELTFICCPDRSVGSSARTAFLADLQREWRLKYGSRAATFTSHGKDSERYIGSARSGRTWSTRRQE